MRFSTQAFFSLLLSGCLSLGQAGPAAIGVVVTKGSFQMDDARVAGNATLFEGATIQTGSAATELRLNNGALVSLGAGARSRVFGDHLLLERGESRFSAAGGYAVRALGLRVLGESAGANGRVQLAGGNKVQVAALSGAMRVTNSEGILVARLAEGTAMEFEPQAAGAAAPSRLTGCLERKGSRYLLTDETTHVTVELEGAQLRAEAGNRVQIVGSLNPTAKPVEASQVIKVTEVKRLAKGCPAGKGAMAGAGAAAGAATGAAAGAGAGTTVAIVAGVAAAATVGGLAAADKLPGQGDDKPSASR